MKHVIVFLLALTLTGAAFATTVDGRVVEVTNNGSVYSVQIQLKVDVAAGLGGATLSLSFDNASLSIPATPVSGADFTFHAYSGGSYSVASVTRPAANRVTANIEFNGGTSTLVNTTYTDVVTITFSVLNAAGASNMVWVTTQAIAEDQFTSWTVGTFTGLNSNPLPIQLASFTAALQQAGGAVQLKWSTASETNNYGFEVQKTLDSSNVYETIANSFIAGNGTSVEMHSYSFTDSDVKPGVWYYRLKQTDLDGTVHYSDKIQAGSVTGVADRPLPTVFALDQNYPNPFNPSTTIDFALPKDARVSLDVYNVIGQRVASLVNEVLQAGYHSVRFNAGQLASGLYIYRIAAGEVTMDKKMMLTK